MSAKVKVAPIKHLTIPKLELTSVVLAARMVGYVMNAYEAELKFENINIWIDSHIVVNVILCMSGIELMT